MTSAPAGPVLVDTHCHLTDSRFAEDLPAVLAAARDQGVMRTVNVGTTVEDSRDGLELALRERDVYATVGVHPNRSHLQPADYLRHLQYLGVADKVVALGEIGLDYYRDTSPRALQRQVFEEQLELAASLNLPVIIHSRDAMPETLRILEEWLRSAAFSAAPLSERPHPGVLHSFSGNEQESRRATELGFLLGLGGPVTFRNAHTAQAVAAQTPLDSLLLETDSPYLSPHPFRGKRNAPFRIPLICGRIAELKGVNQATVARATTANACRLLGWPEL